MGLSGALGCESSPSGGSDGGSLAPPAADVVDAGSVRVEPRPEGRFEVIRGALGGDVFRGVALGDCDGDGRLDVVAFGGSTLLALFAGRDGPRFERLPDAPLVQDTTAAVFADLDGDGIDELVLAGSSVQALPGQGRCRYGAPVTLAGPADATAAQVLVTDVNRDGLADISITQGNSERAPHRLLIARGDGAFDEFTPAPTPLAYEHSEPRYIGFGMFYEDLDGDGAVDLFALLDQHRGWFSWGTASGGLAQSRDDAVSEFVATNDAMGLSPIDHDRDGTIDWFVSGVYSRSRLLRAVAPRRFVDVASRAGVDGVGPDFAWGSYSFDADLDGWPDLLVLRQGPEMAPDVLPAPGPVTLFLNRHDGSFAEVSDEAIGLSLNAKGLACGPLSSDGPVGCFAMDRGGPVLLVDGLRSLGGQGLVRLRGTVSAPDGTGARLRVDGVSPPMTFAIGGQSPYGGEHARWLQVPLLERAAATVTIVWPSGIEQRGVSVTAGLATEVIEPTAVTLSRRVAPADGRSDVVVTIAPSLVGARASAASVELLGVGSWVDGPTVDAGGTVRRVLRAPSAPGEARLIVHIDGRPLWVRPRVVFVQA